MKVELNLNFTMIGPALFNNTRNNLRNDIVVHIRALQENKLTVENRKILNFIK